MDNLIYLDSSFVLAKFEEHTNVSGEATFSKTEGGSASIGFAFARGGVQTQETVSFKKSSSAMLRKILPHLESSYKSIDLAEFHNYVGTKYGWLEGELSVEGWQDSGNPDTIWKYYALKLETKKVALISELGYFTSGFGQVFSASKMLVGNVSIPVRCLVRLLWRVDETREHVAVPLLMMETSN